MYNIIPKVDQTWNIIDIVDKASPSSWYHVFQQARGELELISNLLQDRQYYPPKRLLFEAFFLTPLQQVKVVLIGQDPYHDTTPVGPRAMGLSFSSPPGANVPPSLRNIFKELERSIEGWRPPNHGDLRPWARRGVLLLNSSLTVEPHKPGSHQEIWMGFIIQVLRAISKANPDCIYLLWGDKALKLKRYISGTILTAGHPSSLNRKGNFIGCNHFVEVSKRIGMDWSL